MESHRHLIVPSPLREEHELAGLSPRRDFLVRIALLTGALVFTAPLDIFAAEISHEARIPRRHAAVAHFIRRYSRRYWVAAHPARSRPRSMRILVRVDSIRRFSAALAALPFAPVMAGGNTLAFTHRGLAIILENLPPPDFASRRSQMQAAHASTRTLPAAV